MCVWLLGGLLFWGLVAWRYFAVVRMLRSARAIDEGPVRVASKQIAIELGCIGCPICWRPKR